MDEENADVILSGTLAFMKWLSGGRYLTVGTQAPDFELLNQAHQPVRLYDALDKGWVVLFFYPKDASPVCTQQVCHFRDTYQHFQKNNTTILGINDALPDSHQQFSRQHQLPYALLSDTDRMVRKQYGVSKLLGLLSERVTFVIAPDRTIRMVYSGLLNANAHVEKALQIIQTTHR